MNIKYRKRFTKSFQFISSVLLITLLAVFLAPNAIACHKGKPHGKDKTECPPGDGDGTLPGDVYNTAIIDRPNGIFVGIQNFVRSATATVESGDYLPDGPLNVLADISTHNFSKMVMKGRKNGDMCHLMDEDDGNWPFVGIPLTYSYGWTDDCTDGGCGIEVSMSFEGLDVLNFTSDLSDRIEVILYADFEGATPDEPFTGVSNLITFNYFEVEYKKMGTTRTLVRCRFNTQGHGMPELETTRIMP